VSDAKTASNGWAYNCKEIKTFRELMDHICYDWGFDEKNLFQTEQGEFVINKTTIGKDYLIYKTECFPLAEGLYQELEKLYKQIIQGDEE